MSFVENLSIIKISISSSSSLVEKPILIAVSILSPVNTHSLMPAALINSITSATSSYNLSSMAVEPSKVKSFSINSPIFSIFYYLSTTDASAF